MNTTQANCYPVLRWARPVDAWLLMEFMSNTPARVQRAKADAAALAEYRLAFVEKRVVTWQDGTFSISTPKGFVRYNSLGVKQ